MLAGAAALTGAILAIDATSRAESAYAAAKTAVNFRDRRKSVNPTSSLSHYVKAKRIPQGQPVTIQDTPTPDATIAAAQKDKIIQDDIAAQNANNWWWTNAIGLITAIGGLGVLGGAYFGYLQWKKGQNIDREKRDDDRFQKAVEGLGSDNINAKAASATMLLTFLQQEGYERFHQPIFNLAVDHFRKREVDPENPKPPDALDRAFIPVFTEAILRVRERLKRGKNITTDISKKFLNAEGVHLDRTYLARCDLSKVWMREASFRGASLFQAVFNEAYLIKADFSSINSLGQDGETYLREAKFPQADLRRADFSKADLVAASFQKTNLRNANLREAKLAGVNFTDADLNDADLTDASYTTQGIVMEVNGIPYYTLAKTKWPQDEFNPLGAIVNNEVSVK